MFLERRIKAFTLIELTVVMLISGFLFGIAYLSLRIFQKRYQQFEASTTQLLEVSQAEHLLFQDFAKATCVEAEEQILHFSHDSTQVNYHFSDEYLLRQQLSLMDTFHLSCRPRKLYLLGKELLNGRGLVDELVFDCEVQGEVLNFHFQKRYAAQQLLHHEASSINREN
jgi:prepilin-type N-terminal cleavage/methylation domain-containing protein